VIDPATRTECAIAQLDADGRLLNAAEAIGELVGRNVAGRFEGYYANPEAEAERVHDGWYWSGDLAYRDADGWIYLAGRVGDWLRVDGENMATAPIERILARLPEINRVAVYAVPDDNVGDQIMAALVLNDGATLSPTGLAAFLAAQRDLSPKAWPRYVRITETLPTTATHKVLKRELAAQGPTPGAGELWVREPRGTRYERG
jgi:fatty-acyl-CoA synthase